MQLNLKNKSLKGLGQQWAKTWHKRNKLLEIKIDRDRVLNFYLDKFLLVKQFLEAICSTVWLYTYGKNNWLLVYYFILFFSGLNQMFLQRWHFGVKLSLTNLISLVMSYNILMYVAFLLNSRVQIFSLLIMFVGLSSNCHLFKIPHSALRSISSWLICMSESLQTSTRISSSFTLFKHSLPSFRSQHACCYSNLF